jgi:hypothetical protein
MAMQSVKRFVCYYAGINLVLAALLLVFAWFSPDDTQADAGAGFVPVSHVQEQAAAPALPRT